MDFFSRQDLSRRNTKRLVLYFGLGVISTIVAIYFVVLVIFGFASEKSRTSPGYQERAPRAEFSFWNPQVFLWVTGGTLAVVVFGSLFKIAELSRGGSVIASQLGGRLLNPNSTDPDELKLRNIVEEMALASGVPVPEIYIMQEENGINAFAAGFNTSDAVIGVTRGAIKLLNRDELQGVIAHEFSHILNGDMRLNLRLIGWVHGIICLAFIGSVLMRSQRFSSNRKNSGAPIMLGLALLLIGSIGAFFGKLIKSAISRQREFLADAAAVQFTRNPNGIAGALKKIGGYAYGSELQAPAAEEASHMFFSSGLSSMMATHPPLAQRIKMLDPQFDGKFPRVQLDEETKNRAREALSPTPPKVKNVPPPILPDLLGGNASGRARNFVQSAGQPSIAHLNFIGTILAAMPDELQLAAHETYSATALVYALLLSADKAAQEGQLRELAKQVPEPIYKETIRLLAHVAQQPDKAKLPLTELCLPALRQLSPNQYAEFERNIQLLIAADQQMDLFEFALEKMLLRHLEPHFKQVPRRIIHYYALRGVAEDCAVVLSALAHVGHADSAEAAEAFKTGVRGLNLDVTLRFAPLSECGLERLNTALNRLAQSAPQCKKTFLEAAAETVAFDGEIRTREAELLRAIADSLDCPIPPLLS
ncbi:MAG: M48 family metallopeptidase [Verrucomicrobia bacterium]|nr:M48 family metallopeptidase [Verrucomicrobiota bacterium]